MTTTHRIYHDFSEPYTLLALHSSKDDYRVAYDLNFGLRAQFKRRSTDLDMGPDISFPVFEWKETAHDRQWTLFTNIRRTVSPAVSGLFRDAPSSAAHYLIPEMKEVDYFVKIEGDEEEDTEALIRAVTAIPAVIAAYSVNPEKIKSKNNLIF